MMTNNWSVINAHQRWSWLILTSLNKIGQSWAIINHGYGQSCPLIKPPVAIWCPLSSIDQAESSYDSHYKPWLNTTNHCQSMSYRSMMLKNNQPTTANHSLWFSATTTTTSNGCYGNPVPWFTTTPPWVPELMPATTASMTRFVTAARRPGRAPIMMVSTAKLKVSQRLVTQTCGGQGWLSLVESACLVEVGSLKLA